MNKIFFSIFFPVFLLGGYYINLPYSFSLKKDQIAKFTIYYKTFTYPFSIRWTLFKNDVLVVLYKFDNFPRQVELYKDPPLNYFKIEIGKFPLLYPYLYVIFKDFNDKIATFEIDLFNGKKVKVTRDK